MKPEIRLAFGSSGGTRYDRSIGKPEIRLAVGGPDSSLAGGEDLEPPSLLVSFVYRRGFIAGRDRWSFRSWVIDSGAYSAHTLGKPVDLAEFVDWCLEEMAGDCPPEEIFGLDVIGDPEASLRNVEEMHRQGVPAIPTFHHGSPLEFLDEISSAYPKIALGGMVSLRGKGAKNAFFSRCFDRVWPKPIHGFGVTAREYLVRWPFHTVDSSSWEIGPTAFGNWKTFGRMSTRGGDQNLRTEVDHFLALEREMRSRWGREMRRFEDVP